MKYEHELSADCPTCGSIRVAPLVLWSRFGADVALKARHICMDCDEAGPIVNSIEVSRIAWQDYKIVERRMREVRENGIR